MVVLRHRLGQVHHVQGDRLGQREGPSAPLLSAVSRYSTTENEFWPIQNSEEQSFEIHAAEEKPRPRIKKGLGKSEAKKACLVGSSPMPNK